MTTFLADTFYARYIATAQPAHLPAASPAAAIARPVIRAAEVVLQVVLITVAIAVTAALAYAAFRIRRRRPARRQAMPAYRLSTRTARPLSAPRCQGGSPVT